MYRISSQYQLVTPATAKQWLENCRYPLQRKLRKDRIAMYAEIMRRGDWVQDKELKFACMDGKLYLVNGQHRLSAIVASGLPQMFNVITVHVGDNEQLAAIYNTEDNNIIRTFDDVVRTTLLPNVTGICRSDLSTLKAAVVYINDNFGVRRTKIDSWLIASQIEKIYHEPFSYFLEAISGASEKRFSRTKKKFQRASVVSVAIVTYMESVKQFGFSKVDAFWSGAAKDDGLKRGDPRKVMIEHITNTSMPSGRASMGGEDVVSAAYQSRYVASCFNRWIDGVDFLTDKRYSGPRISDALAPISIAGSSYKG